MNGKRKVLFVLPNLFGGGAERVFTYLFNNINREEFETHLALGDRTGAYVNDIKSDVTLHELKGERARNAIPSLVKLVRALKPDVVFSTLGMNFANSLGRKFYPRGTRVLLREGNSVIAFLEDVARESPIKALFYRQVYRNIYNFADAIICQSDFMLRDMADNLGVPETKLHRIHNPVDFENIDRLANEKGEDIFPKDKFNFISIGKLKHPKGFDILLRAFAAARTVNPHLELTILGDGEERQSLENLKRELNLNGSVRMPGFEANPYVYLKHADAFVSSSRYEGFANVIVESLACGTPVVATDCPSANREVLVESVNGWFAETENVDSLAQAINKAVGEVKNIDRAKIRENCESRFALKQILPHYERLLQS
jgi:glycosyltransferase involved in cell wall biosynthesis